MINVPPRLGIAVALLAFAGACVLRTPLSLLTAGLPPQIQLKDVHGSVWNGGVAAIGVDQMIVQERVEWHFRPLALLDARLEWSLSGRYGTQASTATLSLGVDGARLSDLNAHLPLAPFVALHPKLDALRVGATVVARAKNLSMRTPATATLQIDGLFSPLAAQSAPLGSYLLEFKLAQDGSGNWDLRSLSGVLAAAGQGGFNLARRQFSGQLTINPAVPLPGLSPALSQLPRSGSAYLVTF
jgi:hypothetical protein